MKNETEASVDFEAAFVRLESILDLMHKGKINLNEALTLYEEADGLIHRCTRQLSDAEQKIEILIKNRQNELLLNTDGQPRTEAFHPQSTDL